MIYTTLTETAMVIAYHAYENLIDFAEVPLIFTYYEIASNMDSEDEVVVALVYDTIKKNILSYDDLEELGVTSNQIKAIKILNNYQRKNENEALEEIKKNKIARKVKLAELNHALNLSRYPMLKPEDKERLARLKQIRNYLI